MQRAAEAERARAADAAAAALKAAEATAAARENATAREHAAALKQKEEDAARQVAEAAGDWRRQLDDAHTRFAEERAKLTAEQRRRLADVEADAAKRLAVRPAAELQCSLNHAP